MAKKAWRLIFAVGLIESYLTGNDIWTFRKYVPGSHEFKKGQIIEGHFKDGFMLLLEVRESTKIKPFSKITKREYTEWGAESQEDMMEKMKIHYQSIIPSDTAALIKLRLARIDNRPIAGFLPEGV